MSIIDAESSFVVCTYTTWIFKSYVGIRWYIYLYTLILFPNLADSIILLQTLEICIYVYDSFIFGFKACLHSSPESLYPLGIRVKNVVFFVQFNYRHTRRNIHLWYIGGWIYIYKFETYISLEFVFHLLLYMC